MAEPVPDQSTFAAKLSQKLHALKPVSTKLTLTDGTVQIVDHGQVVTSVSPSITSPGFVVDTKPDLSVAQVTPWLLISSQDVPADVDLLSYHGVTHVLSLLPGFQLQLGDTSIHHFSVELYDDDSSGGFDVLTLKPALDFISSARQSQGRILVHCNAGISRAPSVVMMYLMTVEGMSFDAAWTMVKIARSSAKPNAAFWKCLQNLK